MDPWTKNSEEALNVTMNQVWKHQVVMVHCLSYWSYCFFCMFRDNSSLYSWMETRSLPRSCQIPANSEDPPSSYGSLYCFRRSKRRTKLAYWLHGDWCSLWHCCLYRCRSMKYCLTPLVSISHSLSSPHSTVHLHNSVFCSHLPSPSLPASYPFSPYFFDSSRLPVSMASSSH